MKRRKFTLLELLIVVCIILVLISLLMPAVRKSLQRAKFAVCSSNISQIYRGAYIYSSNNSAYLPPSFIGSTGYSWDDLMSSYVATPLPEAEMAASSVSVQYTKGNVYQCPSDKNGNNQRRSYAIAGGVYVGGGRSGCGTGTSGGDSWTWSQRMTGGKGPTSDRVMFREICEGQKQGGNSRSYANHDWGWDSSDMTGSGVHHKGQIYFSTIFKDGHYEYVNAQDYYNRYYQPGHNTTSGN